MRCVKVLINVFRAFNSPPDNICDLKFAYTAITNFQSGPNMSLTRCHDINGKSRAM